MDSEPGKEMTSIQQNQQTEQKDTSPSNGRQGVPARVQSGSATTDRPFLSVIIPAYNEEKRLPGSLKSVLDYLEKQSYRAEVIIVDDGSEDGTAGVVQRLMSERENPDPHCELKFIASEHRGKGYTVRRGMLAGAGHYVLFSDADLSTPIEDVEKLLKWLEEGYEVAVGSREGAEARRYNEPFYRHIMGRAFNQAVKLINGTPLEDTQCGFKAFKYEACQDIFSRLRLYGEESAPVKGPMVTGFDVEVLFLAHKLGYRVKEVPVHWYYLSGSKVNPLKDSVRNLRDIIRVKLNDLRGLYKNDRHKAKK